MNHTDEQLDLMEWKIDNAEKQLLDSGENQEMCLMNLLKSVSEVIILYSFVLVFKDTSIFVNNI